MAIGDPPGETVYTEHANGTITSQQGYMTDQLNSIDSIDIVGTRPEASEPQGSWWQRNKQWIALGLGAIGSVATGTWLPAAIGALGALANTWLQNKYNQENYQIQKQDALDAEQRANDEYDRRQEDARNYNDSWADRLRSQGFNPLAAISKGGGVTSSAATAPSTTSMPLRQARRSGIGSISSSMSNVLGMLSTAESIKQQQATTANIEAQTQLTRTQNAKESQLVDTFWDRFSKEMMLLGANLRNQNAVADINESLARVRIATEQEDIQQVKYETLSLYYDMKAAEYAPQIANQQLANLALEYTINTYRKRVAANDASASDLTLSDLKAHFASRAANNVADREVLAAIESAEAAASKLSRENKFLPIDKFFGYMDSIVGNYSKFVDGSAKLIDSIVPF